MSNGITHALADLDRLSVGQMASLRERVSAAQVEAFAKLSGDDNPIHLDAAAARSIGEAGPISHGALLLAMLSRLIGTRLPGPGSIWFEQQIEFLAPVYPNDEVEMRAEVVHVSRASRAVVIDVSAVKSGGVQVLRGRAKVRVPQAMAGGATGMDQRDKVALVTGASRGLGRVVAESLARQGMRLTVGYLANDESANTCVAAIKDAGGEAHAIRADVATQGGAQRTVGACVDR